MDTVTIKIKFFGSIASGIGLSELLAPVRREKEKGLEDVGRIVREKAGDQVLYTILINGYSHYLSKKTELYPEDEISIVPIVLGG